MHNRASGCIFNNSLLTASISDAGYMGLADATQQYQPRERLQTQLLGDSRPVRTPDVGASDTVGYALPGLPTAKCLALTARRHVLDGRSLSLGSPRSRCFAYIFLREGIEALKQGL